MLPTDWTEARESLELVLLQTEAQLADHVLVAAISMEAAHGQQALQGMALHSERPEWREGSDAEIDQLRREIASLRRVSSLSSTALGDEGEGGDSSMSRSQLWEELCLHYRVVSDLELALSAAEQRCRELENEGQRSV